jgi:hypothetical protein
MERSLDGFLNMEGRRLYKGKSTDARPDRITRPPHDHWSRTLTNNTRKRFNFLRQAGRNFIVTCTGMESRRYGTGSFHDPRTEQGMLGFDIVLGVAQIVIAYSEQVLVKDKRQHRSSIMDPYSIDT